MGVGIVFVEAIASGTPALGLDAAGATDAVADGDLGTAVAESDLAAALGELLVAPRPDPRAIAAAVRARFDRGVFANRVQLAVDRLISPA